MEPYNNIIKERRNQALQPFFFVANLMDPFSFCHGDVLTQDEEHEADDWILENKESYLVPFTAFKIQDEDFFPKIMFKESILQNYKNSPAKWWKLMERKTAKNSKLPSDFCSFFGSLLSCPPSSAGIERLFSTFGIVWTKLRNRLGSEKAGKLVKVHRYLRHQINEDDDVESEGELDGDGGW